MPADWNDLLLAYLHDPPDKALDIPGHEGRACRYAAEALGRPVERSELHSLADQLGSVAERFPSPKGKVVAVGPEDGHLVVYHPLTGQVADGPTEVNRLRVGEVREESVLESIRAILEGVDGEANRYLAIWRFLPERLAAVHAQFSRLPADTRVPDHTIFNHLDIVTGLKAAEEGGQGPAFLSFSLGPVQSFISTARTVRDLWSGSMILSWLTFQAMLPVLEAHGPTALVYPSLREIPLLDMWLSDGNRLGKKVALPDEDKRRSPCLPNRFLAVVPWGPGGELATTLARRCEERVKQAWAADLAKEVRDALEGPLGSLHRDWATRWRDQIDNFFEIRTALLPWRQASDQVTGELIAGDGGFNAAFPDAAQVRDLADAIPVNERPGYDQKNAGGWQAKVELSARVMQALRSIRQVSPAPTPAGAAQFPPKCSLMGSYEQMGPDGLDDSRRFWEEATKTIRIKGVRLREGERLCALALAKRFASPCFFVEELGLARAALRYEDTATVAAAQWLKQAAIDPDEVREAHGSWSGQWLHWPKRDFEVDEPCPEEVWRQIGVAKAEHGSPPVYYSILMMDGDHLGRWLRGEKSPEARRILHPKLVQYFRNLSGQTNSGLDAKRPVGPALHAAISEALSNFALHFVPRIVKNDYGTVIYAGGDDVLALLPTSRALQCALRLRDTFQMEWSKDESGRERLLMGRRATLSAGLAVVHYKEDLRFALDRARQAEKRAKVAGRDTLEIIVCRRSGEHASALCPWDYLKTLTGWVQAFLAGNGSPGVSDRWAYHLAGESPTLEGLEVEAMRAEIRRQVNRADAKTRQLLGSGDDLVGAFDNYSKGVVNSRRGFDHAKALKQFITLCQSASFLARGRDQ